MSTAEESVCGWKGCDRKAYVSSRCLDCGLRTYQCRVHLREFVRITDNPVMDAVCGSCKRRSARASDQFSVEKVTA